MGILAIILTLLAALLTFSTGLLALSVVLSFSIAWFEQANSDPAVAEQRRYALAVRLMLTEFACLFLTLLLRPLGWLPTRIPAGPSWRPPVILLHGLYQNRSCLFPLHWRLRAAGFDWVVSINTPPWHDREKLVDTVAATVAAVRQASGSDQVYLVGHSMGGILARCYLQFHSGAPGVSSCVTLGTPHLGSKLAPFAVSRLGQTLLPGSTLLTRLGKEPLPADVHFTAIYTRHDNLVVPMENARMKGADNIELAGMGHTTMLFSAQAAKAVVTALESNVRSAELP